MSSLPIFPVSLSETLNRGLLIRCRFHDILPVSTTPSPPLPDQRQTSWYPKSPSRRSHLIMPPDSPSGLPPLFICLHILYLTNYLCPESVRNGGERHAKALCEMSLCPFRGRPDSPRISCHRQIPKPGQETAINMKKEITGSETQVWPIWF